MSTAYQDPIAHAARLLREGAEELKNCHTRSVDGHDWTGEPEDKAAYDEHMAVAAALEAMPRQFQITEPAPAAVASLSDARTAWSAFERIACMQGPGADRNAEVVVRNYLMRAARVGRYRDAAPAIHATCSIEP